MSGKEAMLGISTSWWENRDVNGEVIIGEALDMGFDGIELEYRITGRLFDEMRTHLNRTIKVLSIHNYFPRPEEMPDIERSSLSGRRAGISFCSHPLKAKSAQWQ